MNKKGTTPEKARSMATSTKDTKKAKELVLNLRKRSTTNTQAREAKAGVVFTLDDVKEVIQQQQSDATTAQANPATSAEAAKKKEKLLLQAAQKPQVHVAASLKDILGISIKKLQTPQALVEKPVPERFEKYYQLLMQMREKLKSGLEMHEKDAIGVSVKEATGDLSSYSVGDTTGDGFNLDMALSTVSSDREALEEIENAIRRIHDGSYGICEITGKPIPKPRLLAVPFTRYSLEGRRQLEETKTKKVNAGPTGLNFADEDEGALPFAEDDTEE